MVTYTIITPSKPWKMISLSFLSPFIYATFCKSIGIKIKYALENFIIAPLQFYRSFFCAILVELFYFIIINHQSINSKLTRKLAVVKATNPKLLRNSVQDFLSLFFPNYCVACNLTLSKSENLVCTHCLSSIHQTLMHKDQPNQLQ